MKVQEVVRRECALLKSAQGSHLLTSCGLEDNSRHEAEHENASDDATCTADCHHKQRVISTGEHNCMPMTAAVTGQTDALLSVVIAEPA